MTTEDRVVLGKLETLIARLEALGLPVSQATPRAATDTYGNPGGVATGELIESAWGNAVVDRVVRIFPDYASLIAHPNPIVGSMAKIAGHPYFWWTFQDGVWHGGGIITGGGYGSLGAVPDTFARDICAAPPLVGQSYYVGPASMIFPFGVRITIQAQFNWGFSGSPNPVYGQHDVIRNRDSVQFTTNMIDGPVGDKWTTTCVNPTFDSAPGEDSSFKLRLTTGNLNGAGGWWHHAQFTFQIKPN